MDLSTVRQIFETNSATDSNKYIEAGWILIATASMTTDSREYSGPVIKYSLGWTKEEAPAKPKLY